MAKKKVFVRSAYNYDRDEVSRETGLNASGDGMTQQSFKEECDINTIVRRFGLTGHVPQGVRAPTYGMFDGVNDFHTAANAIAKARESFDAMPADVRRRFENDPGRFVEFCSDPKNLAEMRKMGLAVPEKVVETPPASKSEVKDDSGTKGGAAKAPSSSGEPEKDSK